MLVHTRSKNLAEPEKAEFLSYLEVKLNRLRPRIEKHFPDVDTVSFEAFLERYEKNSAFDLHIRLVLPQKSFATHIAKHSIRETLDFTIDILDRELTEYFEAMRTHS